MARNTQRRQRMPSDSRRRNHPKFTEDYPGATRFNTDTSEMPFAEGGMVNSNARNRLMTYLGSGGKVKKPKAIYVDPDPRYNAATLKVLAARKEQMELPTKKRLQPTGENVFENTPEAYERTTDYVPQEDLQHLLPVKDDAAAHPLNDRIRPFIENREAIAKEIANKIAPLKGTAVQYFYNVGPIHERNMEDGMSPEESAGNLRSLASYIAPTSPRTNTLTNLLNATLLRAADRQNVPYQGGKDKNIRGYNFMDSHLEGARKFQRDEVDPGENTKPYMFMRNSTGNLQPITADTHNVRSMVLALNDIMPGIIPKEWFANPEALDIYLKTNRIGNAGKDLNDKVGKQVTNTPGKSVQTEYRHIDAITRHASNLLGVHPAEAQSMQWFGYGNRTGLDSAPKTLVDLLNERINVTAQVLGEPPHKVWKMVQAGEIPLMKKGGMVEC
jgi:hypothetical protein